MEYAEWPVTSITLLMTDPVTNLQFFLRKSIRKNQIYEIITNLIVKYEKIKIIY